MFDDIAVVPTRDKALIFAILAAIFVGLPYAFGGFGRGPEQQAKPAPSLYAGLPLDAALANATFGERVRARFPPSISEDSLIRTLESDGFRSDGWFGKRMTARRADAGVRRGCDFSASVTWEADDQHRIRTIGARFMRTPGCIDTIPN
jgi:hypothetical protein